MSTIFGKIIQGELPAEKVFENPVENENFLVIKDRFPVAPVHLLILPKQEITNLQSATAEELSWMAELFFIVQKLADDFQIADGYRLLTNNGTLAGQSVFHLHFHLIGGKELGPIA